MSEFEFVIVLMSFIVAFGASELLSGWGRQYLARTKARPYPLQLAASALIFLGLVQSVWGYWGFRSVNWDFANFLLALLPLLPIVGAAGIILPPSEDLTTADSPKKHYEAVSRPIFILVALWIALGTVTEVMLVGTSLHLGHFMRIAGIVMLVGLSFTSKPVLHWVGFFLLAIMQLAFARVVTPTLG